jgi:hypothetical protein
MEVVSVTSKTQFIFKLALNEIFTPKLDIQFITTTVEIKKTQ